MLPDGGVTVEVAFGSDPLAASPVWTDITAYVEGRSGGRTYRGRSGENEDVQPGTLSLVLDNSDGRFTAGLTSSPYYPNVTINRRIRVSAVHDTVTYRLFDGHVDKWPVGWEGGVRPLVTVTATDRFKLLARRPLRTLLEQEVLADSPVLFWPLAEPSGADAAGEVSQTTSAYTMRVAASKYGAGDFSFGNDWRLNYSTAPTFGNTVNTGPATVLTAGGEVYPNSGDRTVELWVKFDSLATTSTSGRVFLLIAGDSTGVLSSIQVWGDGYFTYDDPMDPATGWNAGGRLVTGLTNPRRTDPNLADGQWHHVVVVRDASTSSYYVDGVLLSTDTVGALSHARPSFVWLGGFLPGLVFGNPVHLNFNGQLARVAVHGTELSAARVLEHYNMGRPSFEELSSARVSRLAGYAGIPTGTIETGSSYVSVEQDTSGKGVMDALLEVARSENGLVFIAGDGTLTFQSRAHRQNQTVSVTLDADSGEVDADLEFELSDALTVNDIAVDRPRGGPVRVVDQTSVDTFGTYAEQVSTILTSDAETQAFGQYQLARRATPAPRAGRVSVDPFTDSSLYPAALGTELGSRVSLTNLPATAPSSSVDVVVEGVEHRFSVDGWRTSWDTSPADLNTYMVWDTDVWDDAIWAW